MIIRAGFKATCSPAGSAECRVEGEMDTDSAKDVIDLLTMVIRSIGRQVKRAEEGR